MRSDCPVSYALDFFGDKWSLLVIRDMLEGKRFYKEFMSSKEGIATNILSDRLKKLEQNGIIKSQVYAQQRTQKEYFLTDKGKDLIPVVVEMMLWSSQHDANLAITQEFIKKASKDKVALIQNIRDRLATM